MLPREPSPKGAAAADPWPPRLGAAALLLALLVGLGAWWAGLLQDGIVGNAGLVLHSEQHDGERVVLSLVRVVAVQGPERWRAAEGDLELDVIAASDDRRAGEELTVIGRWDADRGAVVAEEVHPAPGRRGKKLLGIAGMLALVVLLPSWIRPARRGLALRG